MLTLATIVDWKALGETVLAAVVAGLGVTLTFSIAILGATRSADATRDECNGEAAFFAAVAVIGGLATAGALAAGLIVMTS